VVGGGGEAPVFGHVPANDGRRRRRPRRQGLLTRNDNFTHRKAPRPGRRTLANVPGAARKVEARDVGKAEGGCSARGLATGRTRGHNGVSAAAVVVIRATVL